MLIDANGGALAAALDATASVDVAHSFIAAVAALLAVLRDACALRVSVLLVAPNPLLHMEHQTLHGRRQAGKASVRSEHDVKASAAIKYCSAEVAAQAASRAAALDVNAERQVEEIDVEAALTWQMQFDALLQWRDSLAWHGAATHTLHEAFFLKELVESNAEERVALLCRALCESTAPQAKKGEEADSCAELRFCKSSEQHVKRFQRHVKWSGKGDLGEVGNERAGRMQLPPRQRVRWRRTALKSLLQYAQRRFDLLHRPEHLLK